MNRPSLLALVLATVAAMGAAPFARPVRAQVLPFTAYTPESEVHPLPSAEVHKVFQDRLGYIWMGVFSSGLVRYNGRAMEPYTTADGLRDLAVWEALEDPAGRLWVGSNGGLVVSERPLGAYGPGHRIRFTSTFGGAPLLDVAVNHNRMAMGPGGWLWVGTDGKGIVRYRTGDPSAPADTLRAAPDSTGDDVPVRALTARRDGSVWAALLGGDFLVFARSERRPRLIRRAQAGSDITTNVLFEDAAGVLWGGRQNGEVWRLREGAGGPGFVTVSRSLTSNLSALFATADGALWAASEGSGIVELRAGPGGAIAERAVTRANGLLSDIVHHAMQDREGNVWVALSGGVQKLRYNHGAFKSLTASAYGEAAPALPAPSVNAVLLGRGGPDPCRLWAGTSEGGAACVGPSGTSAALDQGDGLGSNWVNGLAYDAQGRLWIGTARGVHGLTFGGRGPASGAVRARAVGVLGARAVLSDYGTTSVLAVSALRMPSGVAGGAWVESVWFPAYHAIFVLVGDAWYEIAPGRGLPEAIYHAAAFDAAGRLWVGTRDQGLYRSAAPVTPVALAGASALAPTFERVWGVESGAPTNQIETLRWLDGVMWVGTPAGLAALDGATARRLTLLTKADGLRADNATSVAVSPATGRLWVGTNGGLAEVDPARRRVVRTVTKQDGLLDNEVWFYGSVVAAPDGTVYFGTAKGIAVYRPALDRPSGVAPRLHLTQAAFTQRARGGNEVSFEYAGLSFADEAGVRYRTRLVGYDEGWSPPRADAKLRYTNLRAVFLPRTYTFEVAAMNGAGVWTAPLAYAFHVDPPLWLRWWAFVLYFAGLGMAGAVGYRAQHARVIGRERARAHERERALRVEAAEAHARFVDADLTRKTEELESARALQLSLLPRTLPDHAHVAVAAHMKTATEVGGDYYDFHAHADGTLTVAIGDATGHGSSAGLVVTATKGLFVLLAEEPTLEGLVRRATRALKRMGLRRLFMAFAILRVRGRTLEYVGAGMPPALVHRAATGAVETLSLKGMPLGSMADYPYRAACVALEPGDTVLLMSDGLPELFSPSGEMLGYDSVAGLLAEAADRTPEGVIGYLLQTAALWAGDTTVPDAQNPDGKAVSPSPYQDDMTFVVLRVKP